MLRSIDAPYVDTRADDLRWSLRHPLVPALTAIEAQVHGRRVALAVLGASHQVVVEVGEERLVETVAYLPEVPDTLPCPGVTATLPGRPARTYDIRTRVDRLAPDMVRDRARWLRRHLGGDARSVVAEFPGTPDALTALALDAPRPGRIGWTTWHVYPQHDQVVRTRTCLTVGEGEEHA